MTTYYASVTDEITGALLIEELECEISAHADGYDLVIDDVMVDGKSLYAGTPLSKAIAGQVVEQAEQDETLREAYDVPAFSARAEHGTWRSVAGRVA